MNETPNLNERINKNYQDSRKEKESEMPKGSLDEELNDVTKECLKHFLNEMYGRKNPQDRILEQLIILNEQTKSNNRILQNIHTTLTRNNRRS